MQVKLATGVQDTQFYLSVSVSHNRFMYLHKSHVNQKHFLTELHVPVGQLLIDMSHNYYVVCVDGGTGSGQ